MKFFLAIIGFIMFGFVNDNASGKEFNDVQIPLSTGKGSPFQVAWCYRGDSLTGHAFLAIGEWRNSELKTRIYGFYPEKETMLGVIYGPGKIKFKPEDQKAVGDARFLFQQEPSASALPNGSCRVLKHITQDQFKILEKQFNEWDNKKYFLGANNCVTMMHATAKLVDLNVPNNYNYTLPSNYVPELWRLNGGNKGKIIIPPLP